MGVPLKATNLWRVIREIDLHAIRAAANAPFELWIVDAGVHATAEANVRAADARESGAIAAGARHAARLRALLTTEARVSHPSVRIVPATDVASSTDPNVVRGSVTTVLPAAAIVIVSDETMTPAVDAVLSGLRRAQVPTVVAIMGGEERTDGRLTPTTATEARVALSTLDEAAAARIGAALVGLVSADLRLALARQLPPMRPAVFELTIDETAKANASYALTTGLAEVVPVLNAPLNLGDMVVLTKNQLVMSYRLVLAAGRDGEPRALIGEILGVLGGGLLFRQLARQLVGLIPIAGLVPKVAIAYGGTWTIGRAVVLWATEGRVITSDLVRSLSSEGLARGRSVATRLVQQARAQRGRTAQRWERLKEHLPLVGRRRQ